MNLNIQEIIIVAVGKAPVGFEIIQYLVSVMIFFYVLKSFFMLFYAMIPTNKKRGG
jgi:hypothetical protein